MTTSLRRRLRFLPKNKVELMSSLLHLSESGNRTTLALAYLINELCPDDRTTKQVFESLKEEKK